MSKVQVVDGKGNVVDVDQLDFDTWQDLCVEVMANHLKHKPLDAAGREYPNPVPEAPPVGFTSQPSMFEVIKAQVHAELNRRAAQEEFESMEEGDDFDVDDDYDPTSPWEYNFDPIADPALLQQLRDKVADRERALRGGPDNPSVSPTNATTATAPVVDPVKPAT